MKKTLYQLLGIKPNASREEIAAAYRAAVDRVAKTQPADQNAIVFLREAYQILRDDARRAAYDAALAGGQSVADEPSSSLADDLLSSPWFKGTVAVVILLGIAAAWRASQPPAKPPAPKIVVVSQPMVLANPTIPAPPAAEEAPAARASVSSSPRERTAEEIFRDISVTMARVDVQDVSGKHIATGSGVVIERETVITNCHVVSRGARMTVKVGGHSRPGTVVVADEKLDLCRLRVSGLDAPAVEIGSVNSLRTGQKVFALGAPHGLDLTISEGIVSSLREVQGGTVIQTTAPISPGSSGGGLFSANGQLVGITTFQHRYGQNLNFAVPADWINEMQSRADSASTARSAAAEARPVSTEPRALIVGNWWCFGPVTGRNGDWNFGANGSVSLVSGGKPGMGNYQVQGKTLRLYGRDSLTLAIEAINAQKMILHAGEGWRLVCDRRA